MNYVVNIPPRTQKVCSVLTALLWWIAGQQMGWFALGWVALLPLFWSLHGLPRRARWKQGYRTGFIAYVLINWWMIPTITKAAPMIGVPPTMGALLGLLATLITAAVHAIGVGLVTMLWNSIGQAARRCAWLLPLGAALLWAACDALRCETQLAHSWGALAYTQWRDVALLQMASVVGQHGLTAFCVWIAASLALWIRIEQAYLWRAPALALLLLHGWGWWHLSHSGADGKQLRVLLVQTAVPSARKSIGDNSEGPLEQALRLTRHAAPQDLDLIVWPETVANITVSSYGEVGGLELWQIRQLAREVKTDILLGADSSSRNTRNEATLYNEALLVGADGSLQSNAKLHVVPFGERAAYGEILPVLKRLAPSPEVTPTDQVHPLHLKSDLAIGTLICFESCFEEPARQLCRAGSRVLFVLSNDEWSSGTLAPWEHAAMGTVRAVENNVPVVQVANKGYTCIIDRHGHFILGSDSFAAVPYGRPGAVEVSLPLP